MDSKFKDHKFQSNASAVFASTKDNIDAANIPKSLPAVLKVIANSF